MKELDRHHLEIVIIEMLNAPITSIITAGLKLLKDVAADRNINDDFLNFTLVDFLLNLNSSLYKNGTNSDNVLNDDDLFKERIQVISHVVNLCKFLKIRSSNKFNAYSDSLIDYGKQIEKRSQNFIHESLECNLLRFTLNELLANQ